MQPADHHGGKMKITIILGAFFPVPPIMGGAVEKIWFSLAPEFARRGHEVMVISRKVRELPEAEVIDGVTHRRVNGFDMPASLWLIKLYDLIYSVRARSVVPRADVVVTNTFWLPLLYRGAYVHVVRYPKGQMRLYARAIRLQAPSRAMAEAIAREAPKLRDRVTMIPNAVPPRVGAGRPIPIVARSNIILYVGRIHPEKGVHLLVDAFANVRTLFADWQLMIVGPASEKLGGGGESYSRSLERSSCEGVVFAGAVFDPVELEATFNAAKLFIYPSLAERGESFGLAPLEAMAHGCAVLVSSLECFRDFITDNETGFVFNHRGADAVDSLASRMKEIMRAPSQLSEVAEAGMRRSTDYSPPRIAEQFLQDFRRVAGHD
jgi:glycosyltransferase involved in cell wall biosynthesis